ncbi:VCBS repeat-containing protein [Halobacillus sp. B29]|uniref:VCBS repeat-containing protein n=1 Tax=Halobacillus sp. B29 TaxID=3457432 RepID=UPI003FCCE43B
MNKYVYNQNEWRSGYRYFVTAHAQGDVNGDNIQDHIYLIGQKVEDSPYVTHITLVIQDGFSDQFYYIPLPNGQGYQPRIFLGDFTGNGIDDILISISSGGSGGFGYFYLYSFVNNQAVLLFDYENFNEWYEYTVTYKDQFRVVVENQTLHLTFLIDLSNRDSEYLAEIYNENGTLKQPLNGWVSGLNQLYPIDFDGNGVYELYALQRVVGRYNADQLGLIQTPLAFRNGVFLPFLNNQYVAVPGVNGG